MTKTKKLNSMDINNALQRAQYLMNSDEFNNKVDSYARSAKRGGRTSAAPLPNEALLEQQLFGVAPTGTSSRQSNPMNYMPQQPTEEAFNRHPGLPREIVESFRGNPSPVSDLAPAVYEQLKGQINEAPTPASTPAPKASAPQAGGAVNYELIKYIVKECIKEQMATLNEGLVKGMRVGNGGVIQFIDTKGNLYEGKLVLKKKKA